MLRKLSALWSAFRRWPAAAQIGAPLALGFVLLILWPRTAHAGDLVVNRPDLTMRLQERPCADLQTLAYIPEGLRGRALHADVVLNGERAGGCWFDDGPRALLVMNDGSGGAFDKSLFKAQTSL